MNVGFIQAKLVHTVLIKSVSSREISVFFSIQSFKSGFSISITAQDNKEDL